MMVELGLNLVLRVCPDGQLPVVLSPRKHARPAILKLKVSRNSLARDSHVERLLFVIERLKELSRWHPMQRDELGR
jgi:hypothetical protein